MRPRLFRTLGFGLIALFSAAFIDSWTQWGQDSQHWGFAPVVGQPPLRILADIVYDPFSAQEQAEAGGSLLTHFQAPLVDRKDVFMTFKSGAYVSCSPRGAARRFRAGRMPGVSKCGMSSDCIGPAVVW